MNLTKAIREEVCARMTAAAAADAGKRIGAALATVQGAFWADYENEVMRVTNMNVAYLHVMIQKGVMTSTTGVMPSHQGNRFTLWTISSRDYHCLRYLEETGWKQVMAASEIVYRGEQRVKFRRDTALPRLNGREEVDMTMASDLLFICENAGKAVGEALALYNDLMAVAAGCRTSAQLVALLPEAEAYLPQKAANKNGALVAAETLAAIHVRMKKGVPL